MAKNGGIGVAENGHGGRRSVWHDRDLYGHLEGYHSNGL